MLITASVTLDAAHQKAAVFATIPTGFMPIDVAVDPLTNRVFVSNLFGGTVTVIDGTTNTVVATWPVAARPGPLALNRLTRRLYVSHSLSGQPGARSVEVLDADAGAVLATTFVGDGAESLRVNETTNEIYVGRRNSSIAVIDGASNSVVATIPGTVGSPANGIDIDEVSNTVYSTDRLGGKLSIIDGSTHTLVDTVVLGGHPWAVAINPARQRIYVTKDGRLAPGGNTVTILDLDSHTVLSTVAVGTTPLGVAVNPVTDRVYVTNLDSGHIFVVDAESETVSQVLFSSGAAPFGVGVNPFSDRVYVANAFSNTVSAIGDDLEPPTWPSGSSLWVNEVGLTSIILQWSPATDNSRVTRYLVYKDGELAATVPGINTSTTIRNLAADTVYGFKVEACDVVDNCSIDGPTVLAGTLSVVEAIERLAAIVEEFEQAGSMNSGQGAGLQAKLEQAIRHFEAGRFQQAVELLDAFVHEVEGLRVAEVLQGFEAGRLTNEAVLIRDYIILSAGT